MDKLEVPEHIVELCIEAGLVWGDELYFDSTKVQANANVNGMIDRANYETAKHLDQLFAETLSPFGKLVTKYNGKRLSGICKPHYQRITDNRISPIDPDAAPMQPSGGGSAVLGYRDHYVVDGGKARIILSALVTPASITDNTPIMDLVDWVCFRWRLEPKLVVGDAKYGTVPNIVGLEKRGIKAYLPTSDFSQRTKYYPAKFFQYDPEKDHYICPQGQILPLCSYSLQPVMILSNSGRAGRQVLRRFPRTASSECCLAQRIAPSCTIRRMPK